MKTESWNLTLLHHTTFLLALQNVWNMFDETDDYPLASRTVKAGFITEEEVEALVDKIGSHDLNKPIMMSHEEILLLYTVMDLNAKLMISHKGDKLREELNIEENPEANPVVKTGHDALLKASSGFVRSVIRDYQHLPAFKSRMEELDKLNQFL